MTTILCLNVGSSSIKAASFVGDHDLRETRRIAIQAEGNPLDAIQTLLHKQDIEPDVIAHRFVHGGPRLDRPVVINRHILDELTSLIPLAPLHLPPAIEVYTAAHKHWPTVSHIACFDTAFHRTIPEVARRFALPENLIDSSVRRYGFHGLSCEHVVGLLDDSQLRRTVIAHLGSGCSLTAIKDGLSVDTTMGLTPAGGIVMGTRPGDLDPGLILYLLNQGHGATELSHAINFESGLHALAGTSDMRALLRRFEADDKRASLAIEIFCYRIAQQVGAYAVTLGGLDALVFTGGIGEHASEIRERILTTLQLLEPFESIVIQADEELVMAKHARSLLTEC